MSHSNLLHMYIQLTVCVISLLILFEVKGSLFANMPYNVINGVSTAFMGTRTSRN